MAEYEIHLKPSAVRDMDRLRKYDATIVADAMEDHLSHHPTKESKSRIKRLKGITDPDYRLRVGNYRIIYSVYSDILTIEIVRIGHRSEIYRRFSR